MRSSNKRGADALHLDRMVHCQGGQRKRQSTGQRPLRMVERKRRQKRTDWASAEKADRKQVVEDFQMGWRKQVD